MRSVFVHLRDAPENEVTDYLAHAYPFRPGPPWIMDVAGDPALFIDIFRHLDRPWLAEARKALAQSLGREPTVSIVADVSGRHPADEQVRAFVCGLLSAFEGVAQDEYTNHCWSSEQIMTGYRVQGHPFFDYKGWHEEYKDGGPRRN